MTERYITGKELADFITRAWDFVANCRHKSACCACAFWVPYDDPSVSPPDRIIPKWTGECRRFSPTFPSESLLKEGGGLLEPGEGVWPETSWNEWCGEFARDEFSALRELELRQGANSDEGNSD